MWGCGSAPGSGDPRLRSRGIRAGSGPVKWAQEARKLRLQGKAEQAWVIRGAFLQRKPVPWTPWSRALVEKLLPRAPDPKSPIAKPRQTIFDCALWHGQHEWVAVLGKGTPTLAPARQPLDDDEFWGAGTLDSGGIAPQDDRWLRLEVLTRRSVAVVRQRHLQPW